ncbi:MAG: GNAT family N-acetyltransferase [Phycisphaeraceae bacterium]
MAEVVTVAVCRDELTLATEVTALCMRTWPWDEPVAAEVEARRLIEEAEAYEGPAERGHRYHVIKEGDRVCAVARTFARTIGTEAGRMEVLALSGVVVEEAFRGRGLGAAVVRGALERVDRGVFGFSLFQTGEHNRGFYTRLGAMVVGNEVINSLATEGMRMPAFNPDELVVVYPEKAGWPGGTIDLLGSGY